MVKEDGEGKWGRKMKQEDGTTTRTIKREVGTFVRFFRVGWGPFLHRSLSLDGESSLICLIGV